MLRGSVRYFVICILSGVTFTALELIIPQILRLTVDSVIGAHWRGAFVGGVPVRDEPL